MEIKPSSRQNPYIRFEQNKPLHRLAINAEKIAKAYDKPVIQDFNAMIEAGQKVAIIGGNGVNKTTLLRLFAGDLAPDNGTVKWAENADIGYMAQDVSSEFEAAVDVFDWMGEFRQAGDDDQAVRSVLGRLLFQPMIL